MIWASAITSVLSAVTILFGYYLLSKQFIFFLSRSLADRVAQSGRLSRTDIIYLIEETFLSSTHILLVIALAHLINFHLSTLFPRQISLGAIATGVFLGIGEMGFSSFLCRLIVNILITIQRKKKRSAEWWISGASAGWIRHHLRAIKLLPLPLALCMISVQIVSEEIMFRGLMLDLLRPLGSLYAAGCSIGLFTIMQVFHMPSWHSAIFPAIGGLVMGTVHTCLILSNMDIVPLVIAHIVFFTIVVL